jgi:plasmid stability protein
VIKPGGDGLTQPYLSRYGLKQQAARHGRSMEAEHRLILEQALFPERRPGRRLLDVLQAGPFAEPDFQPERARDRGRRVEL